MVLKKLNRELPYDPSIPFVGIYIKEMKTGTQKDACTYMFRASLVKIVKQQKQLKGLPKDK